MATDHIRFTPLPVEGETPAALLYARLDEYVGPIERMPHQPIGFRLGLIGITVALDGPLGSRIAARYMRERFGIRA